MCKRMDNNQITSTLSKHQMTENIVVISTTSTANKVPKKNQEETELNFEFLALLSQISLGKIIYSCKSNWREDARN